MKKMNKKGFTLVEIMIVVAIIGLLAAIGIPSILKAYATSQEKAEARNVTEIEKAKGILTLPVGTVEGAAGIIPGTNFTQFAELAHALRITPEDEAGIQAQLKIGTKTLNMGDWTTKAKYE